MDTTAPIEVPQPTLAAQAARLIGGDPGFREVLDALPAAIYVTDADGLLTYFNEAAVALWGHRPQLGAAAWFGAWKLYWPDGRPMPHDQCPMAVALKEGRPVRGISALAERPDGSRVPFLAYPTPLFDTAGRLIGAVNMLVDASDRQHAADAGQRLAAIVESSDDAIISKSLDGTITSWNRGAEQLFGYTGAEVVGQPGTRLIPTELHDEERRILDAIRRGERVGNYDTFRQRKDGSRVEVSLTVSPLRDAEGRIIGASKIARDITERRRAQQQQRLLLQEMKHRIKNTLATVQAIASQTLRSASNAERQAFFARLHALAGAHDLLTDENWRRAPLRDVVDRALAAFREGHRERIAIDGPDGAWLDPHQCSLVTMALHELATNAVKYGALSNATGAVQLAWTLPDAPGGRVQFRWRESGGPPVTPPQHKGFGSLLIERAMRTGVEGARIAFEPQGVTCSFEIASETQES